MAGLRAACLRAIRALVVEFLWHLVAIPEQSQLGAMGGTSMYRFLTESLDATAGHRRQLARQREEASSS